MFGHVMTCHLLTSSVHVVLSSHRQVVSRTDYGWPSTTTPYILTVDVVILPSLCHTCLIRPSFTNQQNDQNALVCTCHSNATQVSPASKATST